MSGTRSQDHQATSLDHAATDADATDQSPGDVFTPEERAQIMQIIHEGMLTGGTYRATLPTEEACVATANEYVNSYVEEVDPQSPIERMLAVQMLWQHGRIARLIRLAAATGRPETQNALNASIDAAMNTFRRQTAAFQELRDPRSRQVINGQQVNVAKQQIIQQQTGGSGPPTENPTNEQGLNHADQPTGAASLSADAGGADQSAAGDRPHEAVAL